MDEIVVALLERIGDDIVPSDLHVRGSDRLEDQVELILEIEANGGGSAIYHGMHEDDLETFLRHPSTMVASIPRSERPTGRTLE